MTKVVPKRVAVQIEGDFVVPLPGMRINKPWKVHFNKLLMSVL